MRSDEKERLRIIAQAVWEVTTERLGNFPAYLQQKQKFFEAVALDIMTSDTFEPQAALDINDAVYDEELQATLGEEELKNMRREEIITSGIVRALTAEQQ